MVGRTYVTNLCHNGPWDPSSLGQAKGREKFDERDRPAARTTAASTCNRGTSESPDLVDSPDCRKATGTVTSNTRGTVIAKTFGAITDDQPKNLWLTR